MKERIIHKPPADLKGLTGNDLKTYVQKDAVVLGNRTRDHIVYEVTTGFGKTYMAILHIKEWVAFSKHTGVPFSINIVVPKENLLKQWEKVLDYHGLLEYVNVYIINTYTMNISKIKNPRPNILIVDEAHRCLNEDSIYFSNLLTICPLSKFILLSASLSEKNKKFLDKLGINTYYDISRQWAFRHDLVPYHTPMNVPIDLTNQEMSDYLTANDEIDKRSRWFTGYGIYHPFKVSDSKILGVAKDSELETGQIKGMLSKWMKAINKRSSILYNAENKKYIALEMLKYIDAKCMVFCKSIDFAEDLTKADPLAVVYHSKLKSSKKNNEKQQALDEFINDVKPHCVSVDGMKEGIDIVDCTIVLRLAYHSDEKDTIQITGRVSRFDENNLDKESFLVNFYVRNFQARGNEVKSKELEWLKKNQASQHNVIWFDSATDAIDYIKEKFSTL